MVHLLHLEVQVVNLEDLVEEHQIIQDLLEQQQEQEILLPYHLHKEILEE